MFIQSEATPNPATLKFLPGNPVYLDGTAEFNSADDAARSPLAKALFSINGVHSVFFGSDFISVTKAGGEWSHLKPEILGAIMEHFTSGAPLFTEGSAPNIAQDQFYSESDAETVKMIKELLETRIRPAVAGDGGDIQFRGFKDGIVYLQMKGDCSGCPSSTATLKHGIQNLLTHFLPAVKSVEQI